MERAALYRRALAPVFAVAGFLGLVSCAGGWLFHVIRPLQFAAWWLGVASFGLLAAFLLIRRQAWQAGEPFWTLPTKRVAQAISPILAAGLAITFLVIQLPLESNVSISVLVPIWHLTYGLVLMSAGLFTPPGIRRLGILFLGWGLLTSVFYGDPRTLFLLNPAAQHIIMGTTFGLGHCLAAAWLRVTQPSRET